MAKLNLDKQESEFLNRAIQHWEDEHLIDAGAADKLRDSYDVKGFDWMRLAKYSFWIALACGFIAVGSLIIDDKVINWLTDKHITIKEKHSSLIIIIMKEDDELLQKIPLLIDIYSVYQNIPIRYVLH